jgi:RNA polymerase sigma factor for flagellar operon FliA
VTYASRRSSLTTTRTDLSRILQYDRARRAAAPDVEERLIEGLTRDQVIQRYARKVMYIARRIAHRLPAHAQLELDDLINSGALGLLDALDKFDPTKNASFGTYVEFRIRGAILDLLRGLDPVSRTVREKSNRLQRVTRELEVKLGRPAESEEVAAALEMTMSEYHNLLHEARSVNLVSLDAPRGGKNEEGGSTLAEAIEDDRLRRPDQELNRKEALRELADAIETALPERLKNVLVMYYYREMSLKEIGAVLGVSESRVSQLHTEACLRLRARLADSLRPGEELDLTRRRPKK